MNSASNVNNPLQALFSRIWDTKTDSFDGTTDPLEKKRLQTELEFLLPTLLMLGVIASKGDSSAGSGIPPKDAETKPTSAAPVYSDIQKAYLDIWQDRLERMNSARDDATKKHFKAELDQLRPTLEMLGVAIPNEGRTPPRTSLENPPQTPPLKPTEKSPSSTPQNESFAPSENRDVNKTTSPKGNGDPNGLMEKYKTTLPPDMPAVFDLQVGSSGKTLRQIIEDTSRKTGVPAILLAAQAWQETKAGLWGKDPAFVQKYGKPGGGGKDVLDSHVGVSTINPHNGQNDSGILQINPSTLRALIDGKDSLGGTGDLSFTSKGHPELQGLSPNNIEDAFLIAGTLMKDMHDFYASKDFCKTDEDAWRYAARAYVGGPGSIRPGDPYVSAAGGGDPTYVNKLEDHMADFAAGVAPRWAA